ncbi:transposable element Tc1 transposase [Trichonephila clavipes]|nr:transposable element Tc1 transposase [Trichonephila clavipes]
MLCVFDQTAPYCPFAMVSSITKQDWACVLFSDRSRFSLSSDCRRQLIWHESGTAYRPENIQEKDRYPTCSIMVWAGIMITGRTPLHVVGTMIDEVLLPHVRLFPWCCR